MNKDTNEEETSLATLKSVEAFLKSQDPDERVALEELNEKHQIPAIKRLLETYPEEMRQDLTLTRAQIVQLLRFSQDRTYGMAGTVPLLCKAEGCDFADICMYYQFGIAPKGYPCPEEVDLIYQMVPQLIQELEVDTENYLEVNMIQEYVDSVIQEHRARKYTALTNAIVPITVGYDATSGVPIVQDGIAPSIEIKERAMRKKEKLRKELLATREMQARYNKQGSETASERASRLRARYEEAQRNDAQDIQEGEFEDITEEN